MNDTKKYLHSINLNEDWLCNNLAIPSPINSVLVLNQFALKNPIGTPLYSCNIDDLYNNPQKCFSGLGSPCFRIISTAAFLRNNWPLYDGYGKEKIFSEKQKQQYIDKADWEIDFEKIRREKFNHKPSRLSSIYLVDDTDDGRITLQNMFSVATQTGMYRPHILHVKIVLNIRYHHGDIKWIDEFAKNKDIKCIENYWQEIKYDSKPRYEHILEGTIIPTQLEEIEFLRNNGTFFEGYDYKQHWQDLKSEQYNSWFS